MRPDQIKRLDDLQEKVVEVFLEEADPDTWSGAGKPLSGMSKDERGGRVFDKKNAINTGTLLARIIDLRQRDQNTGASARTPENDADDEIAAFEGQAKELISSVARNR